MLKHKFCVQHDPFNLCCWSFASTLPWLAAHSHCALLSLLGIPELAWVSNQGSASPFNQPKILFSTLPSFHGSSKNSVTPYCLNVYLKKYFSLLFKSFFHVKLMWWMKASSWQWWERTFLNLISLYPIWNINNTHPLPQAQILLLGRKSMRHISLPASVLHLWSESFVVLELFTSF